MVTPRQFIQSALSFAEATSAPHFHKTAFKVRNKIFATLDEERGTAVFKLNEIDQSAFCSYNNSIVYPVPGAWGKMGWTGCHLDQVPGEMLEDLLRTAYCTVAPAKLASGYRES